jgi:hypothetical protein
MKNMRLFASAVALTLVAVGCGANSHRSSDSYRSRTYGYTIEHPAGWSVVAAERRLDDGEPPLTSGGGTDVIARHASTRVRDMELPVVVIGAQTIAPDTSLEEWTQQVSSIVAKQKGCSSPARTRALTVDAEVATELSYPGCPPGAGLDHRWVAFVHGKLGFQIVWFDASGHEASDRAPLDSMLASVHFSN